MGSKKDVPHRMWTQKEKIEIVKARLEKGMSMKEISSRYKVNASLVHVWCRLYQTQGPERLKSQNGIKRQ